MLMGGALASGSLHRGLDLLGRFLRVLIRHQAGADLRDRFGRDDRLGALPREAAADAVYLEARSGPNTFEQRHSRFPDQFLHTFDTLRQGLNESAMLEEVRASVVKA